MEKSPRSLWTLDSLPSSQESASGPYPDPDASNSEALCDIQFWFKFTQQHSYLEKHIMSLSYDENRQKKNATFWVRSHFSYPSV